MIEFNDRDPASLSQKWRAVVIALEALVGVSALIVLINMWFTSSRYAGAPDFTLADQYGRPFRLSAQRGRTVALFFGYTHCPDVCPTTLAALARAKQKLRQSHGRLEVVFVTVDPGRDTPAVLRHYLQIFDPTFIGLDGTPAQLKPVYAAYHVYHQALPERRGDAGYLVAHSSSIAIIGPAGRIRGYGDWSDSADQLALELKRARS